MHYAVCDSYDGTVIHIDHDCVFFSTANLAGKTSWTHVADSNPVRISNTESGTRNIGAMFLYRDVVLLIRTGFESATLMFNNKKQIA